MPFPPPPAAAFNMTGKPISSAVARAAALLSTGVVVPGTTGTPTFSMACRARVFDPINAIDSGLGPMNFTSAERQARANVSFSLRNP